MIELHLGRVVGDGGFSFVYAVNSIALDEIYEPIDAPLESAARKLFSNEFRGSKYVLKTLRTDLPPEEYQKGIIDLAIEANFLSILQHDHIIQMQAASNTDPYRSSYFVVLDRLTKTLDKKFNEWRGVATKNTGYYVPCYGHCCSKNAILHANWKERLYSAYHLACAVQYLHDLQIMYRDIKPDNIGFDCTGTLKLFDFGLAKSLNDPKIKKYNDDLYLLTGNTGSLR